MNILVIQNEFNSREIWALLTPPQVETDQVAESPDPSGAVLKAAKWTICEDKVIIP